MIFNNCYYDEQSVQYIAVAAVDYSVALPARSLFSFTDIWRYLDGKGMVTHRIWGFGDW